MSSARRFVQVPTDREHSAAERLPYAVSEPMPLGEGPVDAERTGQLLGALVAVLHRYSQQAIIAVDVFAQDLGLSCLALDVEASLDSTVASLIDSVVLRLAASPSSAGSGAFESSNIAVSLVSEELSNPLALLASTRGTYDLHFVLSSSPDTTTLVLVHDSSLFVPETVVRMQRSYRTLLAEVVRSPETAVGQLPLLDQNDARALTLALDSGKAAYVPRPTYLLFTELAGKQPDAPAAFFRDGRVTYRELDQRSNQLAQYLVREGVKAEVPVAVCVRPSLEILVAMLAIWKAGGIYLPLDPTHPESVIRRMVTQAKPKVVLTTLELSALTSGFPQLCFDTDGEVWSRLPAEAPSVEVQLTDAAYLFYTSGTTGQAKGVVATHQNLAHYMESAATKYGFGPSDVFASLARYTFSISLFELLSPLCSGASLRILDRDEVLSPERLCLALDGVTVLHTGPSLLGSLFRYLRSSVASVHTFPLMRHASSGGDMVGPSVMEEMKRVFPNAELFVIYGCTEVSCMGTTFPIDRQVTMTRTFVGKPFPDVVMRVLDLNLNPVPVGVVGEICFAGAGIVRGYLGLAELTKEKFIETDGQRLYRTGDMGRIHPDGNVEILGRRDFQVQLRGIRIELAGIETTVQNLGLAVQCAVVAKTVGEGDLRLVAFLIKPTVERLSVFRRALSAELPDYMLPHHFVVLEAMPLTVNGKLDRNRLREMPWDKQLGNGDNVPPANEREQIIAGVFARVLGLEEVSVEASFFDLGGDSLLGVVALSEIERAIGRAIPAHALFENATVRALANYDPNSPASGARPVLLSATANQPPLFMLSGIHIYRELARRLESSCSSYGVFAPREVEAFDPTSGSHSVQELARDYAEIIRRQQPRGPYRLLGYSFAGIVAYEVAQQLRAAGEEVRFLALVDAALPEWTLGWKFRLAQAQRLWSAPSRDVVAFLQSRLPGQKAKRADADAEFRRYRHDTRLGPLEERREAVNTIAAQDYQAKLRPFSGRVTLIVSGERLRDDPLKSPTCGWGPYVKSLDVHRIDTDHFKMISDDPYVGEMSAILLRALSEARG